jgi:hypothetical protein
MSFSRTLIGAALAAALTAPAAAQVTDDLAARFTQLTRASQWQLAATIPLGFPTHHPQGLVKVGDRLILSSVEIVEPTQRYPELRDGFDRSAGRGVGHLFELDLEGNLLREITLGEGDIYHPGGIDYDGEWLWVPVAEYRPNSTAILYRVDPSSFEATPVLRFADHLGGIVHDTDAGTLNAVSWGSRRFYAWPLDAELQVGNADAPPESLRRPNPAHYIDYQDCHYVGGGQALCSGLVNYRQVADGPVFALGGIELVDLAAGRPVHQLPVQQWTEAGLVMTQNPFWAETTETGLRFYFIPEDDTSRLFIWDVTP